MELWIRSQDKEKLILTNSIEYVCEDNLEPKHIIMSKYETKIYYHKIFVNGNEFAIYDSEKRALEVLDEIQNILKPQMILSRVGKPLVETCDGTVYREHDEYDIKEMSTYVYEMPEE